jgi:uncharacterized membrane protein
VPSVSARDYRLEGATTNITIDPSGIVHVEETISYLFIGHYNEVFRTIKVSPGESVQNIKGHCSDKSCNFSINPSSGDYDLVASIPNPTPENLTFFISYDLYGVINVHKDISEFHYKLWGEEWDRPLGSLEGNIIFPVKNENEIQYWIHPIGITQKVNVEHNVVNLRALEIPANQWYEIRATFPRISSPNSTLVQIDNEAGLEKIRSIENEYETQESILKNIYDLTVAFAILALIFPFVIYYKYGREPKIKYDTVYEKEPPTDSQPAIVNAILQREMGIPSIDGFTATIMDLADLSYISIRSVKPEESKEIDPLKSESEDILIEITDYLPDEEAMKNRRKLEDFEEDAYNLLKKHAYRNTISWNKLKNDLGSKTDFYRFIKTWKKKVQAHTAIDKLFISTGNEYLIHFGLIITAAAVLLLFTLPFFFPLTEFPIESHLIFLLFVIIFFEVILTIICFKFEKVFGSWTPEGKLYYERWTNFKKYLTDSSALKEHPPKSMKVLDCYLVYATALGVAEEGLHTIYLAFSSEELKETNFYPIHSSFVHFGPGFGQAYRFSTPSARGGGGGGVGGIGGGFGGGGGGAF